jgi:hypothetical protein
LASTANAEAKLSFLTNILDERQLEEYIDWLKTIGYTGGSTKMI